MRFDRLTIFSLVVFLAACSSGPKKEEAAMPDGNPTPVAEISDVQAPLPDNVSADSSKTETKQEPVKLTPQTASALEKAQQGLVEAIKSQNDEAVSRAAVQVLALNSRDLKAQNALGLYHYKKGHLVAAQYFFEKALVSYPSSGDLYNNLGLVHLAAKENRDAIKAFRKAIELDSKNGVAAANLGALYVEHKDYTKALVPLEIAIKRGIKDYKTLVNYGACLAGTNKAAQAKEQYEQAIKLNSTGREAIYNLAIVDIEQLKLYQDGLDLLNKVKFLGVPDSARMRINALENKAKAGLK